MCAGQVTTILPLPSCVRMTLKWLLAHSQVRGLSDDHTAHPRYTDNIQRRLPDNHPDCRHFCQNCGIYRSWNALLVSRLTIGDGIRLWEPPLEANLSVGHSS